LFKSSQANRIGFDLRERSPVVSSMTVDLRVAGAQRWLNASLRR
jgi:hypothetical protein